MTLKQTLIDRITKEELIQIIEDLERDIAQYQKAVSSALGDNGDIPEKLGAEHAWQTKLREDLPESYEKKLLERNF